MEESPYCDYFLCLACSSLMLFIFIERKKSLLKTV